MKTKHLILNWEITICLIYLNGKLCFFLEAILSRTQKIRLWAYFVITQDDKYKFMAF